MEPELFTGTILLLPFNFTPQGCAECSGQTLSVQQNPALFSLIGTVYGGDGQVNFMLPNLNASQPLPAMKYYIVLNGIYPPRPN
jgi:microcystin-dependent protein